MLDIARFIKVLALAGSNVDGEALASLRTAQKMLRASNKSFTDVAQCLENGVPLNGSGGTGELGRLRVEIGDALKLILYYQNELDQLRAKPACASLKRTRPQIAAAMRAIFNDPRLAQLADREIARRTGLAPQSVGNWRRRIGAERAAKRARKRGAVHNGRTCLTSLFDDPNLRTKYCRPLGGEEAIPGDDQAPSTAVRVRGGLGRL
jgi:hypothetical protein